MALTIFWGIQGKAIKTSLIYMVIVMATKASLPYSAHFGHQHKDHVLKSLLRQHISSIKLSAKV